jgi:hypothetical protein
MVMVKVGHILRRITLITLKKKADIQIGLMHEKKKAPPLLGMLL